MKKAVVIGATSGIGRALAILMAERGWTVGVTGRRGERLAELEREYPGSFVSSVFDVTSPDGVEKLAGLVAALDGVDLLVYNSGTGDLNPDLDPVPELRTNAVNVEAFTGAMVFAYNYFAALGGGHIAAVTSIMGLRGSGAAPSYAASKAYQINYLEGLRQRSAKEGKRITVTDLRPGSVDTAMMKGEGHFWISSPERAARVIMKAIDRRKAVQYVTPRWRIIGAMLKRLPRFLFNKL